MPNWIICQSIHFISDFCKAYCHDLCIYTVICVTIDYPPPTVPCHAIHSHSHCPLSVKIARSSFWASSLKIVIKADNFQCISPTNHVTTTSAAPDANADASINTMSMLLTVAVLMLSSQCLRSRAEDKCVIKDQDHKPYYAITNGRWVSFFFFRSFKFNFALPSESGCSCRRIRTRLSRPWPRASTRSFSRSPCRVTTPIRSICQHPHVGTSSCGLWTPNATTRVMRFALGWDFGQHFNLPFPISHIQTVRCNKNKCNSTFGKLCHTSQCPTIFSHLFTEIMCTAKLKPEGDVYTFTSNIWASKDYETFPCKFEIEAVSSHCLLHWNWLKSTL
jgi:hypothetical protein